MHIAFYTDNIPEAVLEAQKAVFKMFGLDLHQVKPDVWEGHGGSIDRFLAGNEFFGGENDVIVLWDIDCIPLNVDVVNEAISFADAGGIMGVAQKASHIPNSIIYAGPAFLAFSTKTWRALGSLTFACTERADCAGELTYKAREKGIEVRLLYPTGCQEALWQLDGPIMFGKGTTFGDNAIYHAFYSRKDNGKMFIERCRELIRTHGKN